MRKILAVSSAVVFATAAAFASVTFDPVTGTGFVGKGDVQLVYTWNNKQLQDNAAGVGFQATSVTVAEATWTCDRDAGDQTQERARVTTSTIQGVVTTIARERNQITGFILNGYDGDPTITMETDGPPLQSCPTNWTAINFVQGEAVPVSNSLSVCVNGANCQLIQ